MYCLDEILQHFPMSQIDENDLDMLERPYLTMMKVISGLFGRKPLFIVEDGEVFKIYPLSELCLGQMVNDWLRMDSLITSYY
jgi:hypothetical protein